ncbi:MAG: phosphatidylglycerophosphatase A [Dissulfuribacterales bacterium]
MKRQPTWVVGVATGGFIGKIPFAPGTFGSIPGLFFCYLISFLHLLPAFFLIIGFIIFSIWIAGKAETILQTTDPGCIVIDEIAGMAVTFFAIPFDMTIGVIGFLVFRFFDILKPFPIRFLEKKIHGGTGVVIDDVVAGIMSNVILHLIVYVLK